MPAATSEALLDAFVRAARAALDVSAVILFGSRARGDALDESDYDLIVVSDGFVGVAPVDRGRTLSEIWYERRPAAERRPAEILGFTEAELLAFERPILWDALREGRILFDRGPAARAAEKLGRLEEAGALRAVPGGWSFDLDRIRALRC